MRRAHALSARAAILCGGHVVPPTIPSPMRPITTCLTVVLLLAGATPATVRAQQILQGPSMIRKTPTFHVYEMVFDQPVMIRMEYQRKDGDGPLQTIAPAAASDRHELFLPVDATYRFKISYPSSGVEVSTYNFRTEPALIPPEVHWLGDPTITDGNLLTVPMQTLGVSYVEVISNPGPNQIVNRFGRNDGSEPIENRRNTR